VFSNRHRDRCKILCWERSGIVLWLKRLDKARFAWPKAGDGDAVLTLEARQLNLRLDGDNIR
jgi:transposase